MERFGQIGSSYEARKQRIITYKYINNGHCRIDTDLLFEYGGQLSAIPLNILEAYYDKRK